jgi:GDP-L-fucose synthase
MSVVVLGSRGLVGSAICRELERQNISHIGTTRSSIDITNRDSVFKFFEETRPHLVFVAAAKVGGLMANYQYPVEFLSENILAQTFLMEAAHYFRVERFVFLGSSCIYPRDATQPIAEESLLSGPLELTNEAYAIAKIAGIKLIQGYRREYGYKWISAMPTNLFGINDNFDLRTSHVLPALLRKFHDAKSSDLDFVELWGSGKPRREFMFSDDFASAILHISKNYDSDMPINVGTGEDLSILELANLIKSIVGFEGGIRWNSEFPDGTPRKLLDVSRLRNLGWKHKYSLESAIQKTYNWFKDNYKGSRLEVSVK